MGVHEEESEDLAMAWLGPICQRKRRHLVLQAVWEGEQASLTSVHPAEELSDIALVPTRLIIQAKDFVEEFVSRLVIGDM